MMDVTCTRTKRSRTRHVHHVLVGYTFSYTSRPSCTCRLHVLVHVTSLQFASTRVYPGFWLLSRDSFIKEHTPFESLKIWGLIIFILFFALVLCFLDKMPSNAFSYMARPSCTCRLHVLVHVTSIMYL
jgi:magnesium-transporting ATPase (P-type)